MNLNDVIAIESIPDRSICVYEAENGYTVFRAPQFPTYYTGNGISIERAGPSLAEWEAIHARHFPVDRYDHRTFFFDDSDEFLPLTAAAKAHNYHCSHESFLHLAHPPAAAPPPPAGLVLRRIETEADWQEMRRFDDEQSNEEDWYVEGETELFDKDRLVARAIAMRWDYFADAGTGQMRAKVGSFVHQGVVSLQDVMTDRTMRRQGIATALLQTVIEDYRSAGIEHFTLCADRDEDAIRIYRRLGFNELGSKIVMMTYPGAETD